MVDFIQANISPELTARDNNFSVEVYLAEKSKALAIGSTAGWRRAGAAEPGSYQVTNDTSTNATRLGTTRNKKKSHINQQDFSVVLNMPEITPFGEAVRLKTTMNTEPYTIGYLTTTQWTVAASGGGVQTITLHSGTGLSTYTGKALQIPVGSGANLYTVYNARLESISSNTITLEKALDDAPANAAVIKVIDYVEFEPGGGQLQPWSMLAVISGDEKDKLIHHVKDCEVVESGQTLPADNVGMNNISLSINPETVTRGSRKQPKFMTERMQYE